MALTYAPELEDCSSGSKPSLSPSSSKVATRLQRQSISGNASLPGESEYSTTKDSGCKGTGNGDGMTRSCSRPENHLAPSTALASTNSCASSRVMARMLLIFCALKSTP